jgi:hypothetical protein
MSAANKRAVSKMKGITAGCQLFGEWLTNEDFPFDPSIVLGVTLFEIVGSLL